MTRAAVFACLLSLALVGPSSAQDTETTQRFRELNRVARVAYEKKDWPEAIEAFESAVALIPDRSALYNLACCYALGGKPDEALGALDRAVAAGVRIRSTRSKTQT